MRHLSPTKKIMFQYLKDVNLPKLGTYMEVFCYWYKYGIPNSLCQIHFPEIIRPRYGPAVGGCKFLVKNKCANISY